MSRQKWWISKNFFQRESSRFRFKRASRTARTRRTDARASTTTRTTQITRASVEHARGVASWKCERAGGDTDAEASSLDTRRNVEVRNANGALGVATGAPPGRTCSPEQIRTAVSALRGRRPRPLD